MSEPDDLKRKLAALADPGATYGTRGRIISEGRLPTPVQAILTEVSETVLAQDLTFYIGDIGSLVLVVSGRRILAVRSVEGLVMPAVAEQLTGKPLSATADQAQRALLAVLMQIDLMNAPVETVSSDSAPFEAPPDAGLSPERTATLAGVPYPVETLGALERLVAMLPSAPAATLTFEAGEAPRQTGDAQAVARLQAMADALGIKGGVGNNPGATPPILSIIGQQSGQSPLIGAAVDKSSAALFPVEPQDVGATLALFHKILGSRAP